MARALDRANQHLVERRRNESQPNAFQSRFNDLTILFEVHRLIGQGIRRLVQQVNHGIPDLAMFIRFGQAAGVLSLARPFFEASGDAQFVEETIEGAADIENPLRILDFRFWIFDFWNS